MSFALELFHRVLALGCGDFKSRHGQQRRPRKLLNVPCDNLTARGGSAADKARERKRC